MPLLAGKSNIGHNIKAEEAAGKGRAQSIAIALAVSRKRKAKKMAEGGMAAQVDMSDEAANERENYLDDQHAMEAAEHAPDMNPKLQAAHEHAQKMAHGGQPKLGTGKRFEKLESHIAHEPGIHDPAAVAAAIGRKKYGAHKMGELSHHEHMAEGGEVMEHGSDDEMMKAPDHDIVAEPEWGNWEAGTENETGDADHEEGLEMSREEARKQMHRRMLHKIMATMVK